MIPTFLQQDALIAAPQLLGWKLVHSTPDGVIAGYIVEVEAYTMDDPASHSFRGMTARTAPMFAAAGVIYVYFTYGMHYCLNIVTGPPGNGQAILIRALEPTQGTNVMIRRRHNSNRLQLTSGPAKLTQALGITTELTGTYLAQTGLSLEAGVIPEAITQTTRIGISKAAQQPWRFYITGNPHVSRP